MRAGLGNKYWSNFNSEIAKQIESKAKLVHSLLFNPEIELPLKTLELPLGGSKGVRASLSTLIDFLEISSRTQSLQTVKIEDCPDDECGDLTLQTLKNAGILVEWMTGNGNGSLGLHPAIYFYSHLGRHSVPMFLGINSLININLRNNNKQFF